MSLPAKVLLWLIMLTTAAFVGAWLITKPQEAKPRIGKGDIYVHLKDNDLLIEWTEITGADVIRLYRVRTGQEDTLYGEYTGSSAIMTGVAEGELVYIRIEAVKFAKNLLGEASENVAKTRTLRIVPEEIEQPRLVKRVDLDTQTVNLSWDAVIGNEYEIYQYEGHDNTKLLAKNEAKGGVWSVTFEGTPEQIQGDASSYAVRAVRRKDGYVCAGAYSERISVKPEDLMGLNLALDWHQTDERIYTLYWQETKGDSCEIQQWSETAREWVTVMVSDWSEDLAYVTDRLPSCTEVRFRALAYEGDRMTGKLAVEPSEISFRTDTSPLYCTVWPIRKLNLYAEADGKSALGEIPEGEALCVLGEENERFHVRYNGNYGYVDARYCMINLPEYLGDLCEYDITNSYESIFKVHEKEIPGITKTVVKGYETVCLLNDEMLVPLLYPVAKRLDTAVRAMREDGYSVRIYDAFRPNEASVFLYETTERILGNSVVAGNWTNLFDGGAGLSKYEKASIANQLREEGQLEWIVESQFVSGLTAEQQAAYYAGQYVEGSERVVRLSSGETYHQLMTGGTYSLGAFLAQSISTHNRGIALDLTLVNVETGGALPMQTNMHDLSHYSVLSKNNTNANLLSKYMLDAGFNGLSSEWWHFQDDATKNELALNSYLEKGVSIEGWKRDDKGWKYRCADGSYLKEVTMSVDGASCTFNEQGYLQ